MSAEDDPIPEMPADFAASSPASQWERLQRQQRKTAGLQGELAVARADVARAASEMTPLQAQLAEAKAAREAAEARATALDLRVPLLREGIEDDEVADLVVDRWRRTQAQLDEAARKPIHEWIRTDGPADKIIAPHLAAARRDPATLPPPRVGNPDRGTTTVVTPRDVVMTEAEFGAFSRANAHLGAKFYELPQVSAYFAAKGIRSPTAKR